MTCTTERSAALVSEQLELYRRMWVLRLLDMALQELRIDGLLKEPVQAMFGQEAVAIGATAALRPSDAVTTSVPPSPARPAGLGRVFPWARPSPS